MSEKKYDIEEVHISAIVAGDTVYHNGFIRTVSRKNLSTGFCGDCLFGDSYRMGTILVKRVKFQG